MSQLASWKFHRPFSANSVFPRQSTYFKTNIGRGRFVLHITFCHAAQLSNKISRFSRWVEILDGEHFVSFPLCLIYFICSDHVWNHSYNSQDYQGLPYFWWRLLWSSLRIGWVWERQYTVLDKSCLDKSCLASKVSICNFLKWFPPDSVCETILKSQMTRENAQAR